jgi:hypothetical protein
MPTKDGDRRMVLIPIRKKTERGVILIFGIGSVDSIDSLRATADPEIKTSTK